VEDIVVGVLCRFQRVINYADRRDDTLQLQLRCKLHFGRAHCAQDWIAEEN